MYQNQKISRQPKIHVSESTYNIQNIELVFDQQSSAKIN